MADRGADLTSHEWKLVAALPTSPEQRWRAFESEFGIQQQRPTWMGRMAQSAKYNLDKAAFTAKETAKQLEFSLDIASPPPLSSPLTVSPRPAYSLPLFGKFGQPQLKSVLTEHDDQTGKMFSGLKLVVPFGQGKKDSYETAFHRSRPRSYDENQQRTRVPPL